MQKLDINRLKLSYFSDYSNELTYNQNIFKELIQQEFSIKAFERQIELKSNFSIEKRNLLHKILLSQYRKIERTEKIQQRIDLLKEENTFTITTGHQLSLLTGPLYFIYKILHIIKLSEELSNIYPNKNFIPVYWMANEDHDFEEINHTFLFNQKISWNTSQNGAVGNYKLENWDELIHKVQSFFSNFPNAKIHELLKKYNGKSLAEATFSLVHELFKNYGLLIIDANQKEFKTQFIPVLKKEIESSFSEKCVLKANSKLEKLGFKPQVFSRPINLFYLTENERIRIIPENNSFKIEGVGIFSKDEILNLMDKYPENFSPNVILRPLYQECILPNLAYIGGGAEIAYWTQLKSVFESVNIPFPLIQVRNSIQIFDKNALRKIEKLGLSIEETFLPIEELKQKYIQNNLKDKIDFSLLESRMNDLTKVLEKQILELSPNLKNYVESEKTKLHNQIEHIKQKIKKLQKNQFEQQLKQIEDLKNKLFPHNQLQERSDNFLNFCPDGDYEELIKNIYEAIDPIQKDLIVLKIN